MGTYLFQGCYTSAAIAAMAKTPEDRTAAVRELIESLGGKLDGFWFAMGEYDFVGLATVPDMNSAVAFSIAAGAGGSIQNFKTTPLLTGAEGMAAFKKAATAKYRPPTKSAK